MRCLSEGDQRLQGTELELQNQLPLQIGSKIIVNNLVRWDRWGFHLTPGNRLTDSSTWKECYICSAQTDPRQPGKHHYSSGWSHPVVQGKERYEDEMFIIKYFKKDLHTSLSKGWN